MWLFCTEGHQLDWCGDDKCPAPHSFCADYVTDHDTLMGRCGYDNLSYSFDRADLFERLDFEKTSVLAYRTVMEWEEE